MLAGMVAEWMERLAGCGWCKEQLVIGGKGDEKDW